MEGPSTVNTKTSRITSVLFIIYLIVLLWILLLKLGVQFPFRESRSVNLIPFSQPLILNGKADVGEMILNVLVFVPLGIYVAILFQSWVFGKKLFCFFLISLLIEALQFILAVGAFDITDIITNTFGGFIGFLLFSIVKKIMKSSLKAQRLINLVAGIGTVLLILFLALLKMNMLPIRYQ